MQKRKTAPGSITHVGPHQWRARLMVEGIRVSRTFTHQSDAQRWLTEHQDAARSGRYAAQRLAETMLLREAFERYANEITPRKRSEKNELSTIRRILVALGPLACRPLALIHTSDIATYVRQRLKARSQQAGANRFGRRAGTLTPASINRELALISHLFNTAIAAWGLDTLRNPVVRGVRLKEGAGRSRRLEGDEERRLLQAATSHDAHPRAEVFMVAIIRFALASGMRRGEISSMRWNQVDLLRGSIVLPQTKNGRARSVALSPSSIRLLSSLPRRNDGLVFGPDHSLGTAWKRVRDAAGIHDLRFHDLRHEAVSRLFEETTLSESEIAAISGHLSPIMLRRYTHLRVEPIVRKLAEAEARRSDLRAWSASAW